MARLLILLACCVCSVSAHDNQTGATTTSRNDLRLQSQISVGMTCQQVQRLLAVQPDVTRKFVVGSSCFVIERYFKYGIQVTFELIRTEIPGSGVKVSRLLVTEVMEIATVKGR
jgi:hypothetical protein